MKKPVVPKEKNRPRDDRDSWKTGDQPMTEAQRSFLRALAQKTGEEFDDQLTKVQASKMIDELKKKSRKQ